MRSAKKKTIRSAKYTATLPTKDKQTNKKPKISVETENFTFEKKTCPGQIQTKDL